MVHAAKDSTHRRHIIKIQHRITQIFMIMTLQPLGHQTLCTFNFICFLCHVFNTYLEVELETSFYLWYMQDSTHFRCLACKAMVQLQAVRARLRHRHIAARAHACMYVACLGMFLNPNWFSEILKSTVTFNHIYHSWKM